MKNYPSIILAGTLLFAPFMQADGNAANKPVSEAPAGEHTLQLVLGNHLHIPHKKPVVSEKITVVVE